MEKEMNIRPISEKKRKDIINEAGKLFLRKGFGATSMDEISEAADVSKRTLYNHFPTKKLLFTEIVKREWQKLEYGNVSNPAVKDPETLLTEAMMHTLKVMFSDRMTNLLKLVLAESSKFPELKSLHAKYGMESRFNDFVKYIEYLSGKGILKVDNPRIAGAQYIGLIKECIYWPWFFGMAPKPTEKYRMEIIERANKIFLGHYRK